MASLVIQRQVKENTALERVNVPNKEFQKSDGDLHNQVDRYYSESKNGILIIKRNSLEKVLIIASSYQLKAYMEADGVLNDPISMLLTEI